MSTTQHINTKGIGLGLYISKMIVEKFGGNINLKSEVGRGSSFTFVIALEKITNTHSKIKRCLNPVQRFHQKFLLKIVVKLGEAVDSKFASDQS